MVADLFHYGHINLIKRAKYFKSLSDSDIHKNQNNYLIIGLRTDDCVEKYKIIETKDTKPAISNTKENKIASKDIKKQATTKKTEDKK